MGIFKIPKNHENNSLCFYKCFGKLGYHKGKSWEDFQVNLRFVGWFLACVLLESFYKSCDQSLLWPTPVVHD